MQELCDFGLIAVVHDSRAGRKSYSKANHDCRPGPVLFLGKHKARGSAGQVSVVFQNFVGALDLHGIGLEVQLRTDTIEDLLAAGVDETVVNLCACLIPVSPDVAGRP